MADEDYDIRRDNMVYECVGGGVPGRQRCIESERERLRAQAQAREDNDDRT